MLLHKNVIPLKHCDVAWVSALMLQLSQGLDFKKGWTFGQGVCTL